MKITIAIPSNRGVQPQCFQSVLELIAGSKYEFELLCPSEGYTIAENRNYIATYACNSKSDYLLMIDDDMVFEPDLLDRLIANKKDIVGVVHHPREGKPVVAIEEGKLTDEFPDKLFECHAVGTGIILIKTEILHKIKRPWFAFETYENGCNKLGEDWYFCKQAKDVGYKIYTDPTIEVGHLGEIIY